MANEFDENQAKPTVYVRAGKDANPEEVQAAIKEFSRLARADANVESIIPPPHRWVYVDLKGNWLGLRVEPEDKTRSEAFKDAVEKEERWYNRQERKWMFRTQHGALLFHLLQALCPDHDLILEEDNSLVIKTILSGPSLFISENPKPGKEAPKGVVVGKIGSIEDWSK